MAEVVVSANVLAPHFRGGGATPAGTTTMRHSKALQYFEVAESFAKLSKDPSTKVGTLLLADESNHVLSAGFNGFPRGIDETIESRWQRPEKYALVSHSESNAVAQAARTGTPLNKSTCVVTVFPCADCCKLLIQSGVSRIVTREPDFEKVGWGRSFTYSKLMFEEAGVVLQYI